MRLDTLPSMKEAAALDRSLGFKPIAPWTTCRAVLESSALASWLFDPAIDAQTRVGRSLAFQFEGLLQQLKYNDCVGDDCLSAKVIARINEVERVAVGLGFPRLEDSKRRRTGIGQPKTTIVEIIRQTLNEEALYRALSGMVHAHAWALLQLGFRQTHAEPSQFIEQVEEKATVAAIQKYLEPAAAAALCRDVTVFFAKAVWYKCQLFGWNLDDLANILEEASDSFAIREGQRFWRTSGSGVSG